MSVNFKKSFISVLALLFLGCFLFTYRYAENLSPKGLLACVCCVCGWFLLRGIFSYSTKTLYGTIALLLLWGSAEALWGLGQLYGWLPAGHNRFKITGSFFNPGPYGGFLAVLLPLGLHYTWQRQGSRWHTLCVSLLIPYCIALPATLSRTAWVAALVGCGVVVLAHQKQRIGRWLQKQPKQQLILLLVAITTVLLTLAYGGYVLKKDSANGRLLMWKLSTEAALQQGLVGEGVGSFARNYALAQQTYFRNGGTEAEKMVAGAPEYAFNEYLRIAVEQGFLGLLLWLALLIAVAYASAKNKQYGATGAWVALAVFAFASYPFYLWQLLLVTTLIAAIALQPEVTTQAVRPQRLALVGLICLIPLAYCISRLYTYKQAENQWQQLSALYHSKMYALIQPDYDKLYPTLNSNPQFVFEYASLLNALQQYPQANAVITRALALTSDPMCYNLQGRNYHQMKQYPQAETALLQATYLLPNRIYPYYLLTKLYADPAYYHPQKLIWAADKVLHTPIKVPSPAISEMKEETKNILKQHYEEKNTENTEHRL